MENKISFQAFNIYKVEGWCCFILWVKKTEIRRTAIIPLQSYPFSISETLKDAALQQELPTDPELAAHLPAPMTSLLLFSVLLTDCTYHILSFPQYLLHK